LIDPDIEIRPSEEQIPDLMKEILLRKAKGQRVLVTTLTKRMAEVLTDYLNDEKNSSQLLVTSYHDQDEEGVEINVHDVNKDKTPTTRNSLPTTQLKVAYLHSDVDTLDRSDILDDLRRGEYDVLVGINLLREGLDLPEVTLVAILDADKAGFLRSRTALIQTMGRAARHVDGHVILYADKESAAMKEAIEEVRRRREVQIKYNIDHGITATTISKPIRDQLVHRVKEDEPKYRTLGEALSKEKRQKNNGKNNIEIWVELNKRERVDLNNLSADTFLPEQKKDLIKKLKSAMRKAADQMDFELATLIRDKVGEFGK
jgi:excinuclease ABC subunit B